LQGDVELETTSPFCLDIKQGLYDSFLERIHGKPYENY
jgi:hypothetical protein